MLEKKDIKYILVMLLLVCIYFYKVLLNPDGMFYPAMDLARIYSPMEYLISGSIHQFSQMPLWNPYIFSGIPFVGNPISLLFYPLNMLFVVFPNNSMFGILTMLHVFMAGIFTYLFMRLIKAKRIPSLIAGIIFMFCGVFTARFTSGMLANGIVVSFVPVTFFFTELLLQKRNIKIGIFLSIALTLQFLAAHEQNFLYATSALILYFIIRTLFIYKEKKKFKAILKPLKYFICAFLILIPLSAVFLVPAIETTKHMTRSEGTDYGYGTTYSLPLIHFATFISPDIYGTEVGYPQTNTYWERPAGYNPFYSYIGLFPLVLVIIALLFKRNKYTWSFFGVALFALLFALGKNTPVYYIIYHAIPVFKLFRAPSKMMFMYIFSMSILAGIGSSFLFEKIKKNRVKALSWLKRILLIGLILSSLIFVIVLLNKGSFINIGESMVRNQYEAGNKLHPLNYYLNRVELIYIELIKNLSFVTFLLLSSVLLLNYKIKNLQKSKLKYFMVLIVLLITLDLFFYAMPKIEYVKDPEDIFIKNDLIKFLENDNSYFRIMDTTRSLGQELAIRYDLYKIGGYDAVILSDYNDFIALMMDDPGKVYIQNTLEFDNFNPNDIRYYNILSLLNTKYIITEDETPTEKLVKVYDANVYIDRLDIYRDVKIYENKEVLPRAFIVRNAKVIKDKDEMFEELKNFNPRDEVILEEDFNYLDNKGEFKEAEIVFYSPNKISVNVSLDNSGFLVLSEVYYLGWKAYDNGIITKILKADYILRAVYLEKGEHTVDFVYDPLSYKIGKIITILTILFLIISFYKLRK